MPNLNLFTIAFAILLVGCAAITSRPARDNAASPASSLVKESWKALSAQDYDTARQLTDDCLHQYAPEAKRTNAGCGVLDLSGNINCGLLNDVSQCLYIKFEIYLKANDLPKAKEICLEINKNYFNSVVIDPPSWMWKPAEACNEQINK